MSSNVSIVVLCDRSNNFTSFSEDDMHFEWQVQHIGGVHVHFAWQGQHFRRVVLRVFAGRSVRAASSGGNVQILWQAWGFVTCDGN